MKKNSIKTLYRLFSFLSDFTNGFKPFVKYKLILGSLLIGLTATSCKPKSAENTITKENEPEELSYKKDSVQERETTPEEIGICYKGVILDDDEDEKEKEVEEDENKIYLVVEEPPQFPGGEKELMKYIKDNLRYPIISQENKVEGRVLVRFVVNKKGDVFGVEILQNRGADAACEKEAIRIVKSIPQRWIPAKQNGEAVNVYFVIPVDFSLKP